MNKAFVFTPQEVTKALYDAAILKFGRESFPPQPFGLSTNFRFGKKEVTEVSLFVSEAIPGSVSYEDI